MWISLLATTLGVLGIALNVLLAWPQVWRAARRGAAGIAVGTVLAGFLGRVLWSSYAIRAHDLALFIGQAPVAVGFAAIAFFVVRGRRDVRSAVMIGAGLVTSLGAAATLAVLAPAVLTILAIVVGAVVNLPQMIRTLRSPGTADAVSAGMYWFTAAASATWLSYGIVVDDLAISAPHLVLLPTAVVTAAAVHRRNTGHGPEEPV